MMEQLPQHLQKYIVEQNYQRYTPVDQAVWRYVLRQLKKFLGKEAHESYLTGLEKTGIEIEQIPHIENVSQKLQKFGWRALPVSGFIPPAAFMELQSLGVLPIACDMRSIDHLLYTPAPDIVHEAAGHAPILADNDYAQYLKQYAQVAKKAILSKEDLDQYEAIRELSDLKENPTSTPEQIARAEEKLKTVSQKISFISEGAQLSRMNWWTAEYGLIKKGNETKIFGAGLLSSVGESKWCLSEKVRKIPLSADCVNQGYDITEPQPQLFVAESFQHLSQVLEDFADTMAYRKGGEASLKKLIQAQTVNTVQLENGFQISGQLKDYKLGSDQSAAYVQFVGPTQLCFQNKEIKGHDSNYHREGYGTPIGPWKNLKRENLKLGQKTELIYVSGVRVEGTLTNILKLSEQAWILTFTGAQCQLGDEILFKPDWGEYDILLGQQVTAAFGGPADREAYGQVEDFKASRVSSPTYTPGQLKIFSFFQAVRDFRQSPIATEQEFNELFLKISQQAPEEWLLFVELVEISFARNFNRGFLKLITFHLDQLMSKDQKLKSLIEEGLLLAEENHHAAH